MAREFDAQELEVRWQRTWADEGTYEVENKDPRSHFYALTMYPYPSGAAHQGHVRNYTFGDLVVRYRTMQGYAVLSPLGFDSFGLPAKNAAIKTGSHPRPFTEARIAELKASLIRLGAVFDWRREVRSHDPLYIHANHLIFLKLLEQGLAYRASAHGELVPGLPDGARERAGPRGRHVRALRGPRRAPRASSSGSSRSRGTPTSSWPGSRASSGPSA